MHHLVLGRKGFIERFQATLSLVLVSETPKLGQLHVDYLDKFLELHALLLFLDLHCQKLIGIIQQIHTHYALLYDSIPNYERPT